MKLTGQPKWMLGVIVWLCGVIPCLPALGETNSPTLCYAKIYEQELTGDIMGALSGYRATMATVATNDPVLAEKVLYRIGVCEQSLGNPEETRKVWKRLVDSYPAGDATVIHARAALKFLERELDRVMVEGKVIVEDGGPRSGGRDPGAEVRDQRSEVRDPRSEIRDPRSGGRDPGAEGRGSAGQSVVLAGEWGREPPILTGTGGLFRVERKVAGRSLDGRRYCLIYAEHALLPLVAADILFEQQAAILSGEMRLLPSLALSGFVVDSQGRPIREALIHVTGFKSETPLPFDSILPPIFSSANGEFIVPGLVRGFRYVITAEKNGYRMVSAVEKTLSSSPESRTSGAETCESLVLQSLGEISLRGKVVDEAGLPLQAVVSAWSGPPVGRQLAQASTDVEGRFMLRELRENWVTLKVESEAGLPRSIPGLKPMGQELDVVVKRNGKNHRTSARTDVAALQGVGRQDVEVGNEYPMPSFNPPTPQDVGDFFKSLHWVRGNLENGEPLRWEDLKGHVIALHFGSAYVEASLRAQYPDEPGMLSQIMKLYGDQGLVCVWVLPEGEKTGDSARVALELYPELPIAVSSWKPQGDEVLPGSLWGMDQGNLVIRRNGTVQTICPDQPLFKAVKEAVLSP